MSCITCDSNLHDLYIDNDSINTFSQIIFVNPFVSRSSKHANCTVAKQDIGVAESHNSVALFSPITFYIAHECFASFTEPQFNKDQPVFTHINSSHARLNLQGWASGGCPISAVTLEFRPKGQSMLFQFAIVSNILKKNQQIN